MAQALRNLVNKSRQRIADVYSELEKKLKSSAKKEKALQRMRRNQDENDEVCGGIDITLDPIQEKIKTAELSETENTYKYNVQ